MSVLETHTCKPLLGEESDVEKRSQKNNNMVNAKLDVVHLSA